MSFKITKHGALPDSEYEIEGEITAETVQNFRPEALKAIALEFKVDGFRPGHVPEKMIVDKVGEIMIVEEAGRMALEKNYNDILETAIKDAKIKPLGSPAVTITKVAPGEAFGFKIKTALMPEVKLGDYKKVAKDIMSQKSDVEATDKDIEESIEELRKQVAHTEWHHQNPDAKHHDHDNLPLPEVNEEFIKKFGAYETVEAFKEKVKEGIKAEKERKERDKKRLATMDKILEKADIKMPQLLIDSELNRMLNEMAQNIAQMGLDIDTYLKHINKTIEQLKTDWLPDATKRAKTQLALNQIAADEKLTVDEAAIKAEVDQIVAAYKDIDPMRASIYVETVLLNEKVWQFLEGNK